LRFLLPRPPCKGEKEARDVLYCADLLPKSWNAFFETLAAEEGRTLKALITCFPLPSSEGKRPPVVIVYYNTKRLICSPSEQWGGFCCWWGGGGGCVGGGGGGGRGVPGGGGVGGPFGIACPPSWRKEEF